MYTKKQWDAMTLRQANDRLRLKKLEIKQVVYITDVWGDYFKCTVKSVDVDEAYIEVYDHSHTTEKEPRVVKLEGVNSFYTEKQLEKQGIKFRD